MSTLLNFLWIVSTMTAMAAPDAQKIKAVLEAEPICRNFVRVDEQNVFLGFGHYRKAFEEPRSPIPAIMKVVPLDGTPSLSLSTGDAAIDVITKNGTAYLLTYSAIEEWNLSTGQRVGLYPTYFHEKPMEYREHARAMVMRGDTILIAHGRLGVSFFDTKSKRIIKQMRLINEQLPMESQAMSVVAKGNLAYVLLDSFSLVPPDQKQPFRGLVVVNLDNQRVVAQYDGLDPGADALAISGSKIIVSFMGYPIWVYDLNKFAGRSLPQPESRVWKFPFPGHPTGAPVIDDTYYYTCYTKYPANPGEGDKPLGKVPMALDRGFLGL